MVYHLLASSFIRSSHMCVSSSFSCSYNVCVHVHVCVCVCVCVCARVCVRVCVKHEPYIIYAIIMIYSTSELPPKVPGREKA